MCGMEILSCKEEKIDGPNVKMADCCVSKQDVRSGAVFKRALNLDFVALSDFSLPLFISIIPETFENFTYKTIYFHKYSPPLISQDIAILFQCFRI